ncbi:MAG: hypothetical protein V4733_08615 [Verrucomicrobiota bacterium]
MSTPVSLKESFRADYEVSNFSVVERLNSGSQEGELGLVFSPFAKKYILTRYDIQRPAIFFIDGSCSYYTRNAGQLIDFLEKLVRGKGLKRVIAIGSSKGATGAILHAAMLSQRIPGIRFDVYSFSAQVSLWPYNSRIRLPSYEQLIQCVRTDPALENDLVNFGNLSTAVRNSNDFKVLMTYGQHNRRDKEEAEYLKADSEGDKVVLNPLPIRNHTTIVPYVLDCNDKNSLRSALLSTLERNPEESDIMDLKKKDKLEREVDALYGIRDMKLNLLNLISRQL